jgi:hypothetical protein
MIWPLGSPSPGNAVLTKTNERGSAVFSLTGLKSLTNILRSNQRVRKPFASSKR